MKSILNKLSFLTLILFIVLIIVGCGSSESTSDNNTSETSEGEETENAEDFPNQQIRMVIPHDPGGASDLIFRLVASEAEEHLGQTIVPVNISGASGTTAAREVKDSDPDGYTIFGVHNGIEMAYHAEIVDFTLSEAFDPIALISRTPNILTAHTDSGWEDVDDFIEYVEENPGELKWGHVPGSTDHFFMAELMDAVGLDLNAVNLIPYEGSGELINDLLAQHIDASMNNNADSAAYFGNEFVPLGIAHDERLDEAPDIPTLMEQGVDMTNSTIRGFLAPKGTPEERIVKLEEAFQKALESPEVQEQMKEFGTVIDFKPHDEFHQLLEDLTVQLGDLSENMGF